MKCSWKRGCFRSHWWMAGGLVRGVVVQHQVQVQVLRDGGVDELEEPQEFLVAVPAVWLGDHRPAAHTEHLMAERNEARALSTCSANRLTSP